MLYRTSKYYASIWSYLATCPADKYPYGKVPNRVMANWQDMHSFVQRESGVKMSASTFKVDVDRLMYDLTPPSVDVARFCLATQYGVTLPNRTVCEDMVKDMMAAYKRYISGPPPLAEHQVQAVQAQVQVEAAQAEKHQVQVEQHQVQAEQHQVQAEQHQVQVEQHQVQVEQHQVQAVQHQVQAQSERKQHQQLQPTPDAETLYTLGMMFEFPENGMPQNTQLAFVNYEKAAKMGHAKAQYNLGVSYEEGFFVQPNLVCATMWYKKAADQGHEAAAAALQEVIDQILGMNPADYVLGHLSGCLGNAKASLMLARKAFNAKAYQTAIRYALKAPAMAEAQVLCAEMYHNGKYDMADWSKALEYAQLAADQGHPGGHAILAHMYAFGGDGVNVDNEKALEHARAAEAMYPSALYVQGHVYAQLGDWFNAKLYFNRYLEKPEEEHLVETIRSSLASIQALEQKALEAVAPGPTGVGAQGEVDDLTTTVSVVPKKPRANNKRSVSVSTDVSESSQTESDCDQCDQGAQGAEAVSKKAKTMTDLEMQLELKRIDLQIERLRMARARLEHA